MPHILAPPIWLYAMLYILDKFPFLRIKRAKIKSVDFRAYYPLYSSAIDFPKETNGPFKRDFVAFQNHAICSA